MALDQPEGVEPDLSQGETSATGIETRQQRLARHGHRVRLYAGALVFVGLLVVLIVFVSVNTGAVRLDWAFGSTHASLVWIILAAAVIGWLLGMATAVVFHHRTRRP